jgi:hypothetical protein
VNLEGGRELRTREVVERQQLKRLERAGGVVGLCRCSLDRRRSRRRAVAVGEKGHRVLRDQAPELAAYLLSVPAEERLHVLALWEGRWQRFRTVAGTVAVITAVLAGTADGVLAAVATDHSPAAAVAAGGTVALAALRELMQYQRQAWRHADATPLTASWTPHPER